METIITEKSIVKVTIGGRLVAAVVNQINGNDAHVTVISGGGISGINGSCFVRDLSELRVAVHEG